MQTRFYSRRGKKTTTSFCAIAFAFVRQEQQYQLLDFKQQSTMEINLYKIVFRTHSHQLSLSTATAVARL